MIIDTNNTRRFRHEDGVAVLAIFDTNRSATKYGEVVQDDAGRTCFDLATVRTYFDDEIEELR